MHKVVVIFTGGTISMKVDERLKSAIPAMSDKEILSMVSGIEKIASIETIHFGSYPGPHMDVEKMFELSTLVNEQLIREEITGVVITHGTDCLEETAYLLDMKHTSTKPVVVTGAMRNGSELGYDGPANLSAAICTVCSKESLSQGVLVVMNNQVYSGDEVAKIHTMALDTFMSPDFGPLGIVDSDQVIYYRQKKKRTIHYEGSSVKKVALLKTVAGDDGDLLDMIIEHGYDGIVIEGMGRGNVPPMMAKKIEKAINRNMPVVIVSRCLKGRVLDSYGYEGGGHQLRKMGVILGDNMSGQKARLKLMLILNTYKEMADIRKAFEADLYQTL